MAGALAKLSDSYTVIARGKGLSPPSLKISRLNTNAPGAHKECRIEREKEKKERKKERNASPQPPADAFKKKHSPPKKKEETAALSEVY